VQISVSSPELLTFIRNSRWRRPPSWIVRLCVFGHSGVLIVWYLCSVPNFVQICYSHRSTHICFRHSFDDVTRINFRFRLLVKWSFPHGRDASSHILVQISVSSPELLTFIRNSRWRPPPSWIVRLCVFGHSGVLIVWYLCSVPNFVQICYSHRSTHICFRHSFDDVTRIKFQFRLLVTWSFPHGRDASSHILVQISLSNPELLIFFQN